MIGMLYLCMVGWLCLKEVVCVPGGVCKGEQVCACDLHERWGCRVHINCVVCVRVGEVMCVCKVLGVRVCECVVAK